jgi:hypothetical protein
MESRMFQGLHSGFVDKQGILKTYKMCIGGL